MRMWFCDVGEAGEAVDALGEYGFTAQQEGASLTTEAPVLLATPVIVRRIGLGSIERVDLAPGPQG